MKQIINEEQLRIEISNELLRAHGEFAPSKPYDRELHDVMVKRVVAILFKEYFRKESNQPYKYEVDLTRTIEVTAKDADEAIDKAFDTLREDIPLLSINQDEFSYRANRK